MKAVTYRKMLVLYVQGKAAEKKQKVRLNNNINMYAQKFLRKYIEVNTIVVGIQELEEVKVELGWY